MKTKKKLSEYVKKGRRGKLLKSMKRELDKVGDLPIPFLVREQSPAEKELQRVKVNEYQRGYMNGLTAALEEVTRVSSTSAYQADEKYQGRKALLDAVATLAAVLKRYAEWNPERKPPFAPVPTQELFLGARAGLGTRDGFSNLYHSEKTVVAPDKLSNRVGFRIPGGK